MALGSAAYAQQAQTTSIATDELIQPDTQNFKSGAVDRLVNFVKQAHTPSSQCPTDVDFTVFDSSSDPLWSQMQADTRRAAIEGVLRGLGPSVRVTAKSTKGIISAVIISAQTATDKERPKLDTNSVPRKGAKIKAGDKITVTMVARDNANAWQSGIKTIQLVADSEGGRFIEVRNYLPSPGCLAPPMERRVVATYTVPQNPPPIVRLTALTEDFGGLMDTDVGEFPTVEVWKGSVKLERDGRNPQCSAIKSETEFTIAVAGDGAVTGSGTLDHSSYTCEGQTTPGTRAPVAIGGKKEGGAFTLFLSDWPKTAPLPRIPIGQWSVQVGQGSTGEETFAMFSGNPDVVFRVKLECQYCGRP